MPLYDFRCTTCSHEFERLLSLRDDQSSLRCPECDSPVRRLVSTFATGGGWGVDTVAPVLGGG